MSKGISFTEELRDYLVDHSLPPTPQHDAITRETHRVVPDLAVMQVPGEQWAFMTFVTRLVGARLAVEVGTFTGSSALSIALGLPSDGRLICCDVSEEWVSIGRPHWEAAGVADRIDVRIGPAIETLGAMPEAPHVDLAFIDADKAGYLDYYELLVPRMTATGVIVVDNVLWDGKVLDADDDSDDTQAIRRFNDHVVADARVDAVMLNVADGLTLIRPR